MAKSEFLKFFLGRWSQEKGKKEKKNPASAWAAHADAGFFFFFPATIFLKKNFKNSDLAVGPHLRSMSAGLKHCREAPSQHHSEAAYSTPCR